MSISQLLKVTVDHMFGHLGMKETFGFEGQMGLDSLSQVAFCDHGFFIEAAFFGNDHYDGSEG